MKLKRQTRCKFMDKCNGCTSRDICISPSSLNSPLRKYLLKVCGYRQRPNKLMLEGTKKHKEILGKYPTLAEYGYVNFKRDLFKGKKIEIQEISVCSPVNGFHGIIDYFCIQFKKPNTFNVVVGDLKPFWSSKYLLQIITYGLILSDRNCRIGYIKYTPKSKKKNRITHKLFPNMNYNLNIEIGLNYYMTGKDYWVMFMKDNIIKDMDGLVMHIQRLRKQRLRLHKQGIYFIEHYPPCKDCKQNTDYCSLWEICQKFDYEEEIKHKQLYFGKKNLLIKTKPVRK